jgi:hypothetical protein
MAALGLGRSLVDLNRATELTLETDAAIEELFTVPPRDSWSEQVRVRSDRIKHALMDAAQMLILNAPPCSHRTTALRNLRDVGYAAAAAIAFRA